MIRLVLVVIIILSSIVLVSRYFISTSGFMQSGIMEGIQACKQDDDCIWTPSGCCNCENGGEEILVNKEKENLYQILIKPICIGEQVCQGDNYCHDEEVFCDRTCKFGKREYTKPLLSR